MTSLLSPLFSFSLLGEPVPYRYELVGPPHARRIADAKRYRVWKSDAVARLRRYAVEAKLEPVRIPVVFDVTAWMSRPAKPQAFATIEGQPVVVPDTWHRSTGRVPCIAPGDATNLGKAAEDAVVQAGLLLDDRLCVEVQARKGYAAKGQAASVEVQVFSAVDWYAWMM